MEKIDPTISFLIQNLKNIVEHSITESQKQKIHSYIDSCSNIYEIIYNEDLRDKEKLPLFITEYIYERNRFIDSFSL